jgi:hypothetical protein
MASTRKFAKQSMTDRQPALTGITLAWEEGRAYWLARSDTRAETDRQPDPLVEAETAQMDAQRDG